jgi:hypothetical protein
MEGSCEELLMTWFEGRSTIIIEQKPLNFLVARIAPSKKF